MFFDYLNSTAPCIERLFIIGDLFNFFAGEDINPCFYARIKEALVQACADCDVFFLPGNRDFLLSHSFFDQSPIQVLKDFTVMNIHSTPTLLCHGDLLPTQKPQRAYRFYRALINLRPIQAAFLRLPEKKRQSYAEKIREKSRERKQHHSIKHSSHYLDEKKIITLAKKLEVTQIIHGHYHQAELNHTGLVKRLVLQEWTTQPHHLLIGSDQSFFFTT